MAGTPPKLTSRSFKGQKALIGKQYRTGALGRALNDIYGDIDTAFVNMEAEVTGLDWKNSVKAAVATNGNLAAIAPGVGVDGVTIAADDRILLAGQTDASQNGIYIVQASGAPVRAEDFNADAEVTSQAAVPVDEGGTLNGGSRFRLATADPITVGTTNQTWTKIASSSADAISAVEGEATLDLTGDVTIAGTKSLKVDVITEKDSAAGVTIETSQIKDGKIGVGQSINAGAALAVTGDIFLTNAADVIGRDDGTTRHGNFQFAATSTTFRWGGTDLVTFGSTGKLSLVGDGLGIAVTKAVESGGHDLDSGDTITMNSVRAGTVTVTSDAVIAAGAAFPIITMTADQVLATDVIVANCSIGSVDVQTVVAGSFKVIVTNRGADTSDGSTFVLNWAAL
jgi:hypothetical protein